MVGNKIVTKQHLYASLVGFLETKILIYSVPTNYLPELRACQQKGGVTEMDTPSFLQIRRFYGLSPILDILHFCSTDNNA